MLVAAGGVDDACAVVGKTAEGIMAGRQRGVIMSEMMQAIEPGEFQELFRGLIIAAYDTPQYGTEEMQSKTVREFRNQAELSCYQSAG